MVSESLGFCPMVCVFLECFEHDVVCVAACVDVGEPENGMYFGAGIRYCSVHHVGRAQNRSGILMCFGERILYVYMYVSIYIYRYIYVCLEFLPGCDAHCVRRCFC